MTTPAATGEAEAELTGRLAQAQARFGQATTAGDGGDIAVLLEVKKAAEAVRSGAWHLSGALRLDAEELTRRTERALALAVRAGQRSGTVRLRGESGSTGKLGSRDLIGGGGTLTETYRLADGVSDARFERALAAARAEENLSRRGVVRKLRGSISRPNGRPPAGRASPGPLPDYARDSAWQLRRAVERCERIFADDRFDGSKAQVTAHLHSHLRYAAQVCQDLLGRLEQQTGA
jgi:hypothetical protein